MCGIVGFTGKNKAAPILLEGLARLEYRGYDSAGIAFMKDDKIVIEKVKGRLKMLADLIHDGKDIDSTIGIGHTRWATHGKPSDENSHPHKSQCDQFALVHNGIIENYAVLKEKLQAKGYKFLSETDTEVIVHLLCENYDGDIFKAITKTIAELEGSFALGILNSEKPDEMYAVRRSSTLIVGLSDDGNFIASDVPAILSFTRKIYYLNDEEIVLLTPNNVTIFDTNGNVIEKEVSTIKWDISAAEKGGYDHFMIKEIMEQPTALAATITPRIDTNGHIILDGISLTKEDLEKVRRISIIACGSAYHVGVVGKYVNEELCRIPVSVEYASEFRYANPIVDENSLVIIISQSGETADTLAALREAKKRGAKILSVVNVVGSSIANESDNVLYTWAGPEISVATTKAYSTQLTMMYLIALHIAYELDLVDSDFVRTMLTEMLSLPDKVATILKQAPEIEKLAERYAFLEHAYFIGRNLDFAVSLEASLKLKEISYIHSEAYPAGELKHGTISLIEEGTLVVALVCCERLSAKTMSNIKEVKARGAEVLLLTCEGKSLAEKEADEIDHTLTIPDTHELFMPSLEVIPMQLLGYYISKARKCDIDKPRNLAKSVTVE
jgi:glucosamine--fructose-6-phosphate aminotransferase (isomerizing)